DRNASAQSGRGVAGESREIIQRIELTRDDIGRTAELLARRLDLRRRIGATNGGPSGGSGVAALPARVLASPSGRPALPFGAGGAAGAAGADRLSAQRLLMPRTARSGIVATHMSTRVAKDSAPGASTPASLRPVRRFQSARRNSPHSDRRSSPGRPACGSTVSGAPLPALCPSPPPRICPPLSPAPPRGIRPRPPGGAGAAAGGARWGRESSRDAISPPALGPLRRLLPGGDGGNTRARRFPCRRRG